MVNRSFGMIATLFAIGAMLAPHIANAACPEGRTFSGSCVNTELATTMRKSAIVYSLPKFSYTAPPMLPSEDGIYYVPPDYNEMRQLFCVGAPPIVVTGPGVICR